jgi:Glycosyltransferase sugar-binding region containing DXD motif
VHRDAINLRHEEPFSMATTFNAFWYGPPLNVFHWACMRSFLRLGHEYHLFVYDSVNVPEGVTLVDAATLVPRDKIFFFRNGFTGKADDIGPFSDLFRYKLLLELGGWYVDVDTFCVSAGIPSDIRAWAKENERVEGKTIINGAQMCLPKGDPLAMVLYKKCVARGIDSARREDWGPNLLTEVIPNLGLKPDVFGSTATFYPVDWISAFTLTLPSYRDDIQNKVTSAMFLAAYQSFFQYCGIDLARTPPAGSYLHELYETLAPERMTGVAYTSDEIISRVRAFFIRNRDWAIPQLINSVGPQIVDDLAIPDR